MPVQEVHTVHVAVVVKVVVKGGTKFRLPFGQVQFCQGRIVVQIQLLWASVKSVFSRNLDVG